ncbi:MAG TPA: IS3 family transposase, partial [Hyphomonas sp.]|nr:IS3 family transposase [Hyphomonas sp.]
LGADDYMAKPFELAELEGTFAPLSFRPGEAFQFDRSEDFAVVGGERTKLQVAHIKLSHSRAFLLRAYPLQTHEMLFDAHWHAFRVLGGVPERGIYDNMKTAVDRVGRGKAREVNIRFLAMANHYVFEPEFCNPAAGWEKGQVEKNVRDSRHQMLHGMPNFPDLAALNAWLEGRCIALWHETAQPNQKWLADFTFIWTAEGWLYVAVVLDLFSRRVVGWSMKAERDASLVMDALMMAVWRSGKADALLHHSDQGSQYTSEQFQRLLADNGITCSMSRAGNVWDQAMETPLVRVTMARSAMESFFSSLKTERTARKVYRTRDEARADVFDYIEHFYNPRRRHSKLGYLSPVEFKARAMLA